MYHIRFHSLASVSVIPVCSFSWSPKSHHWHWRPAGNWKGLSTLCGQCTHGLRARTPHTYTCRCPPSYSRCSSSWLSAAPLPRPWSARQRPHRLEQIVAALVTDFVYTTGDCTHVPGGDVHQSTREVSEVRVLHNTTSMRTSLSPLQWPETGMTLTRNSRFSTLWWLPEIHLPALGWGRMGLVRHCHLPMPSAA